MTLSIGWRNSVLNSNCNSPLSVYFETAFYGVTLGRAYEGREDEFISFETEDSLERMAVRQMLDEFEGDAADLEAL